MIQLVAAWTFDAVSMTRVRSMEYGGDNAKREVKADNKTLTLIQRDNWKSAKEMMCSLLRTSDETLVTLH